MQLHNISTLLGYLPINSILPLLLFAVLSSCGEKPSDLVSYSTQIQPLLASHCIECHSTGGEGFNKSGLSMENYANLMKGTSFGPIIKPGDAISSTLVLLIEGKADPAIKMPHGNREVLSKEKIDIIKAWINQGAKNN